jgi:transcriptional regulator with XRE-family HTH domain
MSEEVDMVLSQFIDAWNAGERPSVDAYLERVAPSDRDELVDRLEDWLLIAPSPAYGEQALEAIRAEPALAGALRVIAADPELWPEVLPRLRERAGLRVRDLAARVTAAFGLSGQEGRAEEYLERMERGDLDATRVSRRLLEALGNALGAELIRSGGLRPAAPGRALYRAESDAGASFEQDLEALSQAAMAPAPPPMDELDRLFVGGPDA